jgi:molybdopterin-containing oxidoreductase family membrane subunit
LGTRLYIYTVSTGIGTWVKTVGWAGISLTSFGGLVLVTRNIDFCGIITFRQRWRMAINRSAEAMTIFSYSSRFISIHMGRPWLAYWVLPIPNQFGSLWVNFNSPLLWDVCNFNVSFSIISFLVDWFIT